MLPFDLKDLFLLMGLRADFANNRNIDGFATVMSDLSEMANMRSRGFLLVRF